MATPWTAAPVGSLGGAPVELVTRYEAEAAQWSAAGRPDHAAHLCTAALELAPDRTRTRLLLADCLVRCNRADAAASEYLRVAEQYIHLGRHREALSLGFEVIHLDARQLVYLAIADGLRRVGRAARGLCARGAEAHLRAGRLKDGLDLLRLGVELDADNPNVRRQLARVYLGQHMIRDAVATLAEAARLLHAADNDAEYIEVAEQILSHDPRHLETLRTLPRVHLTLGEAPRAVAVLSELMRINPGDTEGYEILAHAFAVLGRVPTALSVLERLVGELQATGRRRQADVILGRAARWRRDDPAFVHAVQRLRTPTPPAPAPARPRPTAPEGTVVLDLADLMPDASSRAVRSEHTNVLDVADLLELVEAETTLPLHTRRPPSPRIVTPRPPSAPSRAPAAVDRRATRVDARPRAEVTVGGPTPSTAPDPDEAEATQVLDLSDLEVDEVTQVRHVDVGQVRALIHDEDSNELGQAAPCAPRSPIARARAPRRDEVTVPRARALV